MNMKNKLVGASLLGLLALVVSGCTAISSDSHMTRVELYSSIEDLAADSALVAVVSVESQEVAADIDEITDFTLSSATVVQVTKSDVGVVPGDRIVVRQIGSEEQPAPTPLFTVGGTYLLYLTPSGLEGELASQFYVTGANAGIYEAADAGNARRGTPAGFVQADPEEGESLPSSVTVEESLG